MQGRTVRELGEAMGSDELSEWMALESAYGLPDVYFLTGQVCVTLARLLSTGKRAPEVADFVPYFAETTARSAAELREGLRAMTSKG